MATLPRLADSTVTFEPSPEIARLVERYQTHREAARRLEAEGQRHLAAGHRELARRALRAARALAIGGGR